MDTWMVLAIIGVSIFSLMVYGVVALFWPEWVGITGKADREEQNKKRKELEEQDRKA